MAIYHLHAKVIQRSQGQNAVASAAYRRAAKLFDEKEQKTWNYSNKPDVIHSELLVPEQAPAWVQAFVLLHETDPTEAAALLWNQVEASEKRVDSQLAREIEFALPMELSVEQNIGLAREFIRDQFVLRGMIADFSFHADVGNPHIHVMLTMREIGAEGFGKRVLAWNDKSLLKTWREQWAEYANFHLRMHQHEVRIDHRSYEAQEIDLIPSTHLGKAVTDMARRGISTDILSEANVIRRENLQRIATNPQALFDKVSRQRETFTREHLGQAMGGYLNDQGKFSTYAQDADVLTPEALAQILQSIEHHDAVFTEREIVKAIAPFTQHAEVFAKAMVQVKASSELLYLGAGEDGRDRFTTRRMFHLENDLQKTADALRKGHHVSIAARRIQEVLEQHQQKMGTRLTKEQRTAVQHILQSSSISCLVGRAGTGKSFSLGAAKAVWEAQGLKVQGVALSGIATDGLRKDAGIASRTIESFRYAIQQGHLQLNARDVVVMDEAGMADSVSMAAVLNAVRDAKAKLVLVGDPAQIQPVGPGASFRALLERIGFAEIQTVYRQQKAWQREATVAFSAGRVAEGLAAYEGQGCLHLEKTAETAMSQLVEDWLKTRAQHAADLSQHLVVAHRNDDVAALNARLRHERVQRSEIAEGYTVKTTLGDLRMAQGDRLLFLKNDTGLGVSNGRFATVTSVHVTESGHVTHFSVRLDGTAKDIFIHPKTYRDFTHGYAATVHKVQGMTVDHAFVYAGGASWNRHLTYVALSRHRESCQLYADKTTHRDGATLKKNLGRFGLKDSLLDFPLAFAERRGLDISGRWKQLQQHLLERLKTFKEKLTEHMAQFR